MQRALPRSPIVVLFCSLLATGGFAFESQRLASLARTMAHTSRTFPLSNHQLNARSQTFCVVVLYSDADANAQMCAISASYGRIANEGNFSMFEWIGNEYSKFNCCPYFLRKNA
jgi:hypothetical protein